MEQELLPLGSVVKIKGEEEKVLIVGLYSVVYDKEIIVYDYQAVSYPKGLTLSDRIYSFNTEDVVEVIHRGYEDEEYIKLRNKLVDGPYEKTEDDYIMDALEGNLEEMISDEEEQAEEEKPDNDEDLEILVFE